MTTQRQTPQQLFRLGPDQELPDDLEPELFWILIGTNDIADNCSPDTILMGIIRIVLELLVRRPNATLMVHGLLPRPNPEYIWPASIVYAPIQYVNERLACLVPAIPNAHYYDATELFVVHNGDDDTAHIRIDKDLMPDRLHPSPDGGRVWGSAMKQEMAKWLQ